jgi:hypothetical protein
VVLSVCGTAVAAVRFGSRTTESGRGDLGWGQGQICRDPESGLTILVVPDRSCARPGRLGVLAVQ